VPRLVYRLLSDLYADVSLDADDYQPINPNVYPAAEGDCTNQTFPVTATR